MAVREPSHTLSEHSRAKLQTGPVHGKTSHPPSHRLVRLWCVPIKLHPVVLPTAYTYHLLSGMCACTVPSDPETVASDLGGAQVGLPRDAPRLPGHSMTEDDNGTLG